jgi:hypothetical protein
MSASKQYVLDANVFIQASQGYYGFAVCPGFWRALVIQHERKRVCSIDKIKAELLAGHDELSEWAKDKAPATFFKGTADKAVGAAFAEMVKWVQVESQFTPEAKAGFASAADGWLIAYARANGLVVVTHEEYAPAVRRKVPMPNLCLEFRVEYCNVFDMLQELKVKFVLRTKRGAT